MSGLRLALGARLGTRLPPVAPLGNSLLLQAVGAELTLSALGGDGMYTATSVGGVGLYVHSPSAVTGDVLLEVAIVNHANTAAFGLDVAAGSLRGSANFDESINPDEGFGANALDYYQNGVARVFNLTRNGRFYLERVGSTINIKTGASWADARYSTPLHTRAATSTSPYYFQANLEPAGQWKMRLVQYPA